jgi:hypothetical protein
MAGPLNPRTPATEAAIENLRDRIKKLDDLQNRAMELAAFLPMSKKETQNHEERGQRLNDLRRVLLNLMQNRK